MVFAEMGTDGQKLPWYPAGLNSNPQLHCGTGCLGQSSQATTLKPQWPLGVFCMALSFIHLGSLLELKNVDISCKNLDFPVLQRSQKICLHCTVGQELLAAE